MKKRIINSIFCIILLSLSFQSLPVKATNDLSIIGIDNTSLEQADKIPPELMKIELSLAMFPDQPNEFDEEHYLEMRHYERERLYLEHMSDLGINYSSKPYTESEEREYTPPTAEVIAKTQEKVRSFDCSTVTDVPQTECEALVALYDSTNGAGWENNTNWLVTKTVDDWYGIVVYYGNVISIELYGNQLTGTLPTSMEKLSYLRQIYLSENYITGPIPVQIGNLSNLEGIWIGGNYLTGNLPTTLGNLSKLNHIELTDNQLTGTIPYEMSILENLGGLRLGSNQLTGTIPLWLGNLSNLVELSLPGNQLTGSIPAVLGNLSKLYWLELNGNQLTGSIPKELGNLSNLFYLFLGNNQLTGSIPNELGNLSNLNFLWLGDSQLTGNIPLNFINLTKLETIYFRQTSLCEPNTPEFLAWKATVDNWYGTGVICQSIELTGIEVTQSIQNLLNDVILIEDKPTFVRAHVRSTYGTVENVKAELIVKRPNGTILGSLKPSNPGMTIDVYQTVQRELINDSFYFKIPKSWLNGEVLFEVQGIPHEFICKDQANIDNDCKAQVTFQSIPEINLKFVGVEWWEETSGSIISHRPEYVDFFEAKERIEATFPIKRLSLQFSENINLMNTNWNIPPLTFSNINLTLFTKRLFDGCGLNCNSVYFGVIVDPPYDNGVVGLASFFQPTVASSFHSEKVFHMSIPHELGHVYGEKDDDKSTISQVQLGDGAYWGFDTSKKIIYRPETKNLMSYSWNSLWQSKLAYERIYDQINNLYGDRSTQLINDSASNILVRGFIDLSQDMGSLEELFQYDTVASYPTYSEGEYRIELVDGSGEEIASYYFDVDKFSECPFYCEDDPQIGIFALSIPYNPDTKEIRLFHDTLIMDTISATLNEPDIEITYPNGGELISTSSININWNASDLDSDILNFIVQYSSDAGVTWETIGTDIETTNYLFNLSHTAGSETAMIRVFASDGFHTSVDTSNVFTIEKHAPFTKILSPEENDFFVVDQTLVFSGLSVDNEDGELSDSNLRWSSNVDGILGAGSSLAINALNLSEGLHTITLSGQDSDGQIGEDSINIVIYRERPTLQPSLSAAPNPIYFSADVDSGVTEERDISIRNDGDGEMTWTAEADQDWVYISQMSGTAPSEITISADTNGLAVGVYEATIIFTASSAINSPQEIVVYLTISDNPTYDIFLPILMR